MFPRKTGRDGEKACGCGRTRREFLWEAGAGFTGLALAYLLDRDGFFGRRALAAESRPAVPHFAPRAKSVIFLFMYGGPSQVDTFDYKPELQKLNGKPVPDSIKKAVQATKHANVFHG